MTKNNKKFFNNKINSEPPHKNYETKKSIIKSFDDTWSADFLKMNDYVLKNNNGY